MASGLSRSTCSTMAEETANTRPPARTSTACVTARVSGR